MSAEILNHLKISMKYQTVVISLEMILISRR